MIEEEWVDTGIDEIGVIAQIHDLIMSIDADALAAQPVDDALCDVARLAEAARVLSLVRAQFEDRVAARLADGDYVLPGVGVFRARRRTSRTRWDTDGLLRAVLDSRRADHATGEILDETPLDRVLHVWRLDAPRVTALRERGIDPDEWCTTERGARYVQIIGGER